MRPSEHRPEPSSGFNRTPVPSGVSRQFGDSGTRPSQWGQVIVRAQMKFVDMASMLSSGGKHGARRSSLSRMKRTDKCSNSDVRALPYREGHSTVARIISADTGLRSFAIASAPSRATSKGMLPSSCSWVENREAIQGATKHGHQPILVVRIRNVTERPRITVCLSLETLPSPPSSVNSPSRSHRIPMNTRAHA